MAVLSGISNLQSGFGSAQVAAGVNAPGSPAEALVQGTSGQGRVAPSAAGAASATARDLASVSSTAQGVSQALSTSDVRADKVSALQSAIASGNYHVTASEVAGRLVDQLLK